MEKDKHPDDSGTALKSDYLRKPGEQELERMVATGLRSDWDTGRRVPTWLIRFASMLAGAGAVVVFFWVMISR